MAQTAYAEQKRTTFYLNGLNCANCAGKIETAIKADERYEDVGFSFATKKLTLKSALSQEAVQDNLQQLVDSIEEGVTVGEKAAAASGDACSDDACTVDEDGRMVLNEQKSQAKVDKGVGTIILGVLRKNRWMVLGTVIVFLVMLMKPTNAVAIPGYVLAYVLIGGDVAYRAFKNLFKGNLFDENFLMTVATFGAFALGEYTEAVMVMFFYKIGEGFQDYAVDYSRRSIKSLLDIKAEFANLVAGKTTKKVTPESLRLGDIIMVKAGEKVPVDGRVVEGQSTVDMSALTGESLPRTVAAGDPLLSGAINKEGLLKVEVTKTYENSTVARILDMVENATGKKAKTEQFITKFARVYTPIVVFSAVAMAALPPLLGFGGFRDWLSRALIFLVISCPCALVLSVPLGYFGGLGVASRMGILIKGGNYLEALNTIDTFVFDKTGTVTKGNFAVQHVTDDKTLSYGALLEQHSNHPIATSIMAAYGKDVAPDAVKEVKEIPGEGLTGLYDGAQLLVGNDRLMTRMGIEVTPTSYVGTVVHVAYEGAYIGAIHIADEIKPGVESLSESLKAKGAKSLVMLTGDQSRIANHVAESLNFDQCHSELLPEDKLVHVEGLLDGGGKVLFAGDGINDAPVLARADIGVAMGGLGSDAAIEAADIVLMTDEPMKLNDAIAIARKTRRIVLENIIFALGVKLFFLSLGAMGIATMYEAIFADVGVAVIAVLNSMRILRFK